MAFPLIEAGRAHIFVFINNQNKGRQVVAGQDTYQFAMLTRKANPPFLTSLSLNSTD
jgi:hypothetical protein